MLSSVLNSKKAIAVNIIIMRVSLRLRRLLLTHKDLALRLEKIEQDTKGHSEQIQTVFEILKQLPALKKSHPARLVFIHKKFDLCRVRHC